LIAAVYLSISKGSLFDAPQCLGKYLLPPDFSVLLFSNRVQSKAWIDYQHHELSLLLLPNAYTVEVVMAFLSGQYVVLASSCVFMRAVIINFS